MLSEIPKCQLSMEEMFSVVWNNNDSNVLASDDFTLVWFNDNINYGAQWHETTVRLRQIINHLEVFENLNDCVNYLSSIDHEKLFLIISSISLNKEGLLDLINQCSETVRIYLLSNTESIDSSRTQISCDNKEKLIDKLSEDVKMSRELLSTSIIDSNVEGESTHNVHTKQILFKCFELLIEIVRRSPLPPDIKKLKLLEYCRSEYKHNPIELQKIDEFEQEYSSDKAIVWYSRDCCLNDLLNRALLTINIDVIICANYLTVYRGHLAPPNELKILKRNIGGLVVKKSYWTTTLNRNVALMFAGDGPHHHPSTESILYVVDLDVSHTTRKPVANIKQAGYYRDDDEVLISINTIFRIDSVELDPDYNIWIVHLTSCDDEYQATKQQNDYFDIVLLELTEILRHMSPNTDMVNEIILKRCRLYCKDNPRELAKINEFEMKYRSDDAVRWYTKDSFLYRLLNIALRTNDVSIIVDLRCFIIGLYDQLLKIHVDFVRTLAPNQKNVTVYRGQLMTLKELSRLKRHIGGYILIKTFFSATTLSQVALIYSGNGSQRPLYESVLYVIDLDISDRTLLKQPFANIALLSQILDENEILFPLQTIFKIISVKKYTDDLWIVHLVLGTNDKEIDIIQKYLKIILLPIEHYNYSPPLTPPPSP
ncbi:unnamed protein product [Didymodactylos carnosus]|uniref:Uncharacterized protein n=1 Tax=Didymodactylos carnosus TaxID=1234261 RepID=A0A814KHB8_9BILA|nr:unnamed protein product [Didymodactylos carnosus]CAF1173798.1 unnamed protein product [Didymodactylos carnosus]CAF3821339.1 unnamed protein product [Didymodactylos carnosus]CAF3985073.1 unnamed protein product [Didymodactylos carnosus]